VQAKLDGDVKTGFCDSHIGTSTSGKNHPRQRTRPQWSSLEHIMGYEVGRHCKLVA